MRFIIASRLDHTVGNLKLEVYTEKLTKPQKCKIKMHTVISVELTAKMDIVYSANENVKAVYI